MLFKIIIVWVLNFIIVYYMYFTNAKQLIKNHKYSMYVDFLAWTAGLFLASTGYLFFNIEPSLKWIIWIQVLFASSIFNIHLARFIIRISLNNKA